jgi:hypothetical protein
MQTLKIKCIQLEVSTGVLVLIGPTEDCEEDTSSMVHRLEHATLDVYSHAPWSKAWCDHHEEYNPPCSINVSSDVVSTSARWTRSIRINKNNCIS